MSAMPFAELRAAVERGSWNRARIKLLVQIGNGFEVMDFDKELANAASIGDEIEINGGGKVRKTGTDSWLQWTFVPGAE